MHWRSRIDVRGLNVPPGWLLMRTPRESTLWDRTVWDRPTHWKREEGAETG